MRIHKLYIVLGLLIALGVFFELAAHAEETSEFTQITFSKPVQIPGQVLPAGTYLLQRADSNDPNIVQIFSADRRVLFATLFTVPAERSETTSDTAITLAEEMAGKPEVLVKWFYPGRTTGHEFVYPQQQEKEIAQARQETFIGNELISSPTGTGE
jgi:hypothetical protein